jgi:hypothetical protein
MYRWIEAVNKLSGCGRVVSGELEEEKKNGEKEERSSSQG